MSIAIPYVRFSTPKQEKGDSKERQLETCLRFIEEKGWIALDPIMDLGLSAYKGDHLHTGALGKFTRQVIDGEIEQGTILVVEQLDRLSRQGHRKALRWLEDMTERGIKVAVVGQNRVYDHESLSSNLIETLEVLITGKAAHDYSVRLSERVGSAWRKKIENASDGNLITKTCPGWLVPVENGTGEQGTSFEVNEVRADVIRQIYQWSADGLGIRAITHRLNSTNVENWGRQTKSEKRWGSTQVLRLLEHPAPEGDYVPYLNNRKKENGERVIGYYPRIVDALTVDRARAALKERRGTGAVSERKEVFGNIFQGLMHCGHCKGRFVMRRGPHFVEGKLKHPGYLSCENAWQGKGCEGPGMFQYLTFEKAVIDRVLHLSMDDQLFRKPEEVISRSSELAEAEKTLRDLEARQANLIALMEKVSDPTPLLTRYEVLSSELVQAQAHIEETKQALTIAKGQVPNDEALAAARLLKDAIMSFDKETRLTARRSVARAMKLVIKDIKFTNDGPQRDKKGRLLKRGKRIQLSLSGLHFMWFDDRGKLLSEEGFSDEWTARDRSLDVLMDADEVKRTDKVVRRMRAAKA